MSFYSNFLKLCSAKDVKPSRAAAAIGLSNAAATGWKNGKLPQDTTLQKLADYFGVTVNELMSENENKPAPKGNELNLESIINNMSREDLIEFIMLASARLKNIE